MKSFWSWFQDKDELCPKEEARRNELKILLGLIISSGIGFGLGYLSITEWAFKPDICVWIGLGITIFATIFSAVVNAKKSIYSNEPFVKNKKAKQHFANWEYYISFFGLCFTLISSIPALYA